MTRTFNIYYNQHKRGSTLIVEQCPKHKAKYKATAAIDRSNDDIVTVATACLNSNLDQDNNNIAFNIALGRLGNWQSNGKYIPLRMQYNRDKGYEILGFEGTNLDPAEMGINIKTHHDKLTHAILYNIALKRFANSRTQHPTMINVLQNSIIKVQS